MNASIKDNPKICLGIFGAPHGVRGDIRVKTFTDDPSDIAAYGQVFDEAGKQTFTLKVLRILKDNLVLARSPEIKNREQAGSLTGTKFYINRSELPAPMSEDEFYIEDLIGIECVLEDGSFAGRISAVHDFGAGDLLEVKGNPTIKNKGGLLVRFTREHVPTIDLTEGRIVLARDAFDDLGDGSETDENPQA